MAAPRPADAEGIAAAVAALRAGRLVLHPTETLPSLSGDPYAERAVSAARALKGYADHRPFLCLVAGASAARGLAAEWPPAAARAAEAFWPGPLTLVVRAGPAAPAPVLEGGRLALRPASDPVSTALLAAFGGPVFSTSANPAGEPPAVSIAGAAGALDRRPGSSAVAVALADTGGPPPAGLPSTVVDVSGERPRLVRAGAVSREDLARVLGALE